MAKCGKGCMPECEYFTTSGCISPFNCPYKIETGYINSATSIPTCMEQIVKERDSKEEAYNKCYFDYRYWKDKAKEYKHRTEVAERALNCACYDKARTYCPNDDWREVAKEYKCDYIQQAEREIEEEKK